MTYPTRLEDTEPPITSLSPGCNNTDLQYFKAGDVVQNEIFESNMRAESKVDGCRSTSLTQIELLMEFILKALVGKVTLPGMQVERLYRLMLVDCF